MCFTKTWHSDAAAGPPACDGGDGKLGSDSTRCHMLGRNTGSVLLLMLGEIPDEL